jgi:hypothetical protein
MKKLFILLAIMACLYASCKKATDLTAPRLFKPVPDAELKVDSNTIVASWQKIAGATAYEIQLSRDTFQTINASMVLDTNVAVVKKLFFNQLYQVQVRSIAADTTMNSKWSSLGAIKTLSSILKVPGLDDITYNSVRVRWVTKGAPVTAIKIIKTADSSLIASVPLSAGDVTNEYKIISGLEMSNKYTIFLYSGQDERGYVDFSTKAPFSGAVIDLTSFTGRPGVLADTLPVIPSGSTVLLKRGETYNISSTITLSKSLTIMSAPDLLTTQQARIYFTSNFVFGAGASIDYVTFSDVYMVSDNYGARFVFNNSNSANVGKISFMNSRVEIFRGIVRLQAGTTTVNDLVIDNCIIDSIGSYAMVNIQIATTRINNISITNSTIYKVEGVISSAQPSTTVLISDCTFNEAPLGNNKNAYVDYGANNVTAGVTVSNCIFGIGKNSAGNITVKGIKVGTGTTIAPSNNYRTQDYKSGGNDIPNVFLYNRPSTQLWVDPAKGNFQIADITFPGRNSTGDPRWR